MKYSIHTKIVIIFIVGIIILSVLFFALSKLQDNQLIERISTNQQNAINWLVSLYNKSNIPDDLEEYFGNFYLAYVNDYHKKDKIIQEGLIVRTTATPFGQAQIINYKDFPYIKIQNEYTSTLLESTVNDSKNTLIIGYAVVLIMFIVFYISIYKALIPLKKLRVDIKRFANGDIDNMCQLDNSKMDNNEIAEVAFEFNKAACKIKDLLVSRQLFLRTIMHELNTPIGKGRIISEMVETPSYKRSLVAVFERLNMLINEFGRIEQLLSKSYSLNYAQYNFSVILDQVKDLLMLKNFDKFISLEIKTNLSLVVDFQLFTLTIKNLLDNALKYSTDKKAILIVEEDRICVKNKGNPLAYPIDYYLQAFTREKSSNIAGMGLGLYIINTICAMHKYTLEYNYEDGFHCFYVVINETKKI